jgi:hypothetical protein
MLTREEILSAPDIGTETVDVPEWGGQIHIRTLTGAEYDRWQESILIRRGDRSQVKIQGARVQLIALCIVDDNGKRIFTDKDIPLLNKKSSAGIARVYDAVCKQSRIGEGEVEELVKNSGIIGENDSGTDSPSPSEEPSSS